MSGLIRGAVKIVYRYSIVMTGGVLVSFDQTIPAVVLAKAAVNVCGFTINATTPTNADEELRVVLLNSTTLALRRNVTAAGDMSVSVEVIEYY